MASAGVTREPQHLLVRFRDAPPGAPEAVDQTHSWEDVKVAAEEHGGEGDEEEHEAVPVGADQEDRHAHVHEHKGLGRGGQDPAIATVRDKGLGPG